MSIKGANGVSDNALGYGNGQFVPTCVAVQLNPGASYTINSHRFFAKPGVQTVIVVPQIEARYVPGSVITSPDVDLDFSNTPGAES